MTAVEWLLSQKMALTSEEFDDIIQQANELFEQQIKDAYVSGFKDGDALLGYEYFDDSQQYYNETYKKPAVNSSVISEPNPADQPRMWIEWYQITYCNNENEAKKAWRKKMDMLGY